MNIDANTPRIAMDSLGCKLNQAEIEYLARQLTAAGYTVVAPDDDDADIYILNTCTVTHVADRKARQRLRLAHRRNPDAGLVAIGCYAERDAGELAKIEGVDLVIGNDRKWDLLKLIKAIKPVKRPGVPIAQELSESRRTRAFIRIQDGCRNSCAYQATNKDVSF